MNWLSDNLFMRHRQTSEVSADFTELVKKFPDASSIPGKNGRDANEVTLVLVSSREGTGFCPSNTLDTGWASSGW